jgi:hypothetical protein
MGSAIFELIVVLLLAWFVWRFVARIGGISRRPGEPDDYVGVSVRLRPRPNSNAGAVELIEPDEDDDLPQPFATATRRRVQNPRSRCADFSGA